MIERLATLLVSCPDRKGIVASLAQVLYAYGANILDADQHTDPIAQMFFQRIRFDLSTMTTDRIALEHGVAEVAARFGMTWRLSYASQRPRVAILVSKLEHCLYDLLLRHRAGELRCDVAMVISNHPDLEGVAHHFGLPYHHLPVTAETRGEQEQKLLETLGDVDLVVLARYMQILSPTVVERFLVSHHQHPSLVPSRVRRREPVSPGLRQGRQADRRDQPLRHRGPRPGTDHRAGRDPVLPRRQRRGPRPQGPRRRDPRARLRGALPRRRSHPGVRRQDRRLRLRSGCWPRLLVSQQLGDRAMALCGDHDVIDDRDAHQIAGLA
jgi:predicted amino acid-binding ACT domain protein